MTGWFGRAEWVPPDDVETMLDCDLCQTPTNNLVVVHGDRTEFAICDQCVAPLVNFMNQVLQHNERLTDQWNATTEGLR